MNDDKQSVDKNTDYVESILTDIGGTFNRFQIFNYILFCIPFALSGTFGLSYVFTTLDLDYRCHIPGCESLAIATYEPDWLENAVPYHKSKPLKCARYETVVQPRTSHATNQYPNNLDFLLESADMCPSNFFNQSHIERCNDNEYIYKTDEVTIVNEFNLTCDENNWKLAMVGTVNNIGRFIFTPFMGNLSDRFGRRTILIIGVFGSSVFALIRSFATNYLMFIVFEFLDAGIGSVTYSAAFILAMEWIGVKDRALLGTIVTATYPIGQIFLGLTAREIRHFRHLLRIIYAPGFLIIAYIWIAPESIRWLLVNGKRKQIIATLNRAAYINGINISNSTLELVNKKIIESDSTIKVTDMEHQSNPTNNNCSMRQIFRKSVFRNRFLICAFVWITSAFVSYGISLTSVSLAGDKYINFVVIATAGIPAMLICYILLETCGRRWTLCSSLAIGGICIIGSKLLPINFTILSITFFFLGKCFITIAFTGLYVYTSELWPTNIRHSMMALCSTIGRIGAMFAPLAPLLIQYLEILPYLTFGGMAFIASILILRLPETLNRKLPDTIEEAERIGNGKFDETS